MRDYQAQFPTAFSSPSVTIPGGRGGLNGMPSAYDSLSRQARAHVFNRVKPVCKSVSEAVAWSFRLIDAVSVPGTPSSDAPVPGDGGMGDFTQWQIVRDHKNLVLYSRTWDNLLPKALRLDEQDFSEGAATPSFAMGGGSWVEGMAAAA